MTTVAYIVDRYPRLSQTFISNEVAELRRLGLDVAVVALDHGDAAAPEDGVLVLRDFVPTSSLDRFRTRLTPRRDSAALAAVADEVGGREGAIPAWKLPALARVLGRQGVRHIHAHFGWQAAGTAWALAAQLRIPWSLTLHANDIFGRPRNLKPKLDAAARIITVCDYNARYLRDELGVTRPIDLVVCGVEVPPEHALVPFEARDVDVVAVGRLVAKKGFDTLIRAVGHLRDDHPSIRVVVVGDGPERDALQQLVDELGVAGNVELAGALPHHDVLAATARARVFALPARIAAGGDRDSMPVVIKEAMARQVPVVASDVAGVPEMVDRDVGRLVAPDDAHALAKAIAELLDDRDLATRLGTTARARVRERFTLTSEVRKLAEIFEGAR